MRSPTPPGSPPDGPVKEEPEVTQEESIPNDGRDEVGEKMMEELGRDKSKQDTEKKEPDKPARS